MFLLFPKGRDPTKNVLFSKIEGRKMFCKKKKWFDGKAD